MSLQRLIDMYSIYHPIVTVILIHDKCSHLSYGDGCRQFLFAWQRGRILVIGFRNRQINMKAHIGGLVGGVICSLEFLA